MGVFEPDVRMNGASFAPNRMFIRRAVWPQLTITTHTHTVAHTHTLDDSNSRSFHRNESNDQLKSRFGVVFGTHSQISFHVRC
jgi:hypothetical protein